MQEIKVFAGNASKQLGQEVVKLLGLPLGDMDVLRFADGEISVSINESVRGADVFIVQSTCNPVNDNLMELLVAIDAFKRASAGRITAVMPYFGYARQDRKSKARDPISAKLVADILTAAGADRVLTMDLHAAQIQGFFNIPVDHLLGVPLLAPYFGKLLTDGAADDSLVAVSPDLGSVTRARGFASYIEASLAIVDKRRPKANVSEVMNIIGDIHGKTCILVDDMVDTAGTLCQAADALKRFGASKVYACATHGVLSGPALERIEASCLEELVLLDTIPLPESKKSPKIRMLSVVPIFSEAISRINRGASVSTLFN